MATDMTRYRAIRRGNRLHIRPGFGFVLNSEELVTILCLCLLAATSLGMGVFGTDELMDGFWRRGHPGTAGLAGIPSIVTRTVMIGCGLTLAWRALAVDLQKLLDLCERSRSLIELGAMELVRDGRPFGFVRPIESVEVKFGSEREKVPLRRSVTIRLRAGEQSVYIGTLYSPPGPGPTEVPGLAIRIAEFYRVPLERTGHVC
jgi:hypothetical protein